MGLVLVVVAGALVVLSPPLKWFAPPGPETSGVLLIKPRSTQGPEEPVDVLVDAAGIPHIFAKSTNDAVYALGTLHGRERTFQLIVLKHAAYGRLAELFGDESLLEVDSRLRVVGFGLDAQFDALEPRDKELCAKYVAGLNTGALDAGESSEMAILQVRWESFEARDVLALARLQQWELAMDYSDELFRASLRHALGSEDPRFAAVMAPVPSGGVPIVARESHSGRHIDSVGAIVASASEEGEADAESGVSQDPAPSPENSPGDDNESLEEPSGSDDVEPNERGQLIEPKAPAEAQVERYAALQGVGNGLAADLRPWFDELSWGGSGASNSWVVSGDRTASGAPVLCNDPHLSHRAPSVFYLAHIETPEFSVVGATFPGLPAVLIGQTRHLSWGMTTSFVDAQDLFRLQLNPEGTAYLLDGVMVPFEVAEEVYRVGKGGEAKAVRELRRGSVFGPVLTEGFADRSPEGETYALRWSAFDAELNDRMISSFFDLYRADSLTDVDEAVRGIRSAGQNMVLALRDGTIAYRLATVIPVRGGSRQTHLPRDGTSEDNNWLGYLATTHAPQLENPESGYIVAANQRVVDDDWETMVFAGGIAAGPHRAQRIHERLEELLSSGKASADELLAIQQDVLSVEARKLASILGRFCPVANARTFCRSVANFDGIYNTESLGALPYTLLLEALRAEVLVPILGLETAEANFDQRVLRAAVERALIAADAGAAPALFEDPTTAESDGAQVFVARALSRALEVLGSMADPADPASWRWGIHHTLAPQHPLQSAPAPVGAWFDIAAREQSGYGETVRAEDGLPVRLGAALRMVSVMETPPKVRMILDSGNGGYPGTPHYLDMRERWEQGMLIDVELEREALEKAGARRIQLSAVP